MKLVSAKLTPLRMTSMCTGTSHMFTTTAMKHMLGLKGSGFTAQNSQPWLVLAAAGGARVVAARAVEARQIGSARLRDLARTVENVFEVRTTRRSADRTASHTDRYARALAAATIAARAPAIAGPRPSAPWGRARRSARTHPDKRTEPHQSEPSRPHPPKCYHVTWHLSHAFASSRTSRAAGAVR